MNRVPPERWPLVLAVHAVSGVLAAFAVQALAAVAVRAAIRPGLANAIVINVVWPATVAALAVWYPRLRTVWFGSVLLVLAFVATNMAAAEPRPWRWNVALLAAKSHPIMVAAIVGCGVVGSLCVLVTRVWRRVEPPDEGPRCAQCRYVLRGVPADRCPECGAGIAPVA